MVSSEARDSNVMKALHENPGQVNRFESGYNRFTRPTATIRIGNRLKRRLERWRLHLRECRPNRIARRIAVDNAGGREAPTLTVTDIDGRNTERRCLKQAAGGISDNRVDLS